MKRTRNSDICLAFLLIAAVFFFMGCGNPENNKPGTKGSVLAVIGKSKITTADLDERISNLPARYQDVVKKDKKEFLQEVINDTLLYQEAVRMGLNKDQDALKVIEEAKKKILTAKLLKDTIDDKIDISGDEVKDYYGEHKDKFMTPEIMRVSHILSQTNEDATAILEKLKAGEDFESTARAKSVDPTAQRGGDIGYFPRGQLMPEFEEASAKLEIGGISGIVKTKLGYHIIKLTDRKLPEARPLEQVEGTIKSEIRKNKRQRMFNDLLKRLHETTVVKVNEEALK